MSDTRQSATCKNNLSGNRSEEGNPKKKRVFKSDELCMCVYVLIKKFFFIVQ